MDESILHPNDAPLIIFSYYYYSPTLDALNHDDILDQNLYAKLDENGNLGKSKDEIDLKYNSNQEFKLPNYFSTKINDEVLINYGNIQEDKISSIFPRNYCHEISTSGEYLTSSQGNSNSYFEIEQGSHSEDKYIHDVCWVDITLEKIKINEKLQELGILMSLLDFA